MVGVEANWGGLKWRLHSHLRKGKDGKEAGEGVCWAGIKGKVLKVERTKVFGHKESHLSSRGRLVVMLLSV